ncbi:MAG: hypothetical protein AB7I38_14500 [Dehalococcoidia bacterium]
MSDHEDASYGLVMPFVATTSNGGPFDDQAFVAGYECGSIDMALHVLAPIGATVSRWVHPELLPQLDLIAMRHGRQVYVGDEDDTGTWRHITIDLPQPTPEEPS